MSRRAVFARARAATVAFGIRVKGTLTILGSGVIVESQGVVVTARHVLDEVEATTKKLRKSMPDTAQQFVIIGETNYAHPAPDQHSLIFNAHAVTPTKFARHSTADLAVAWFDQAPITPTALTIDYEADIHEGDPVATCGFPYGLEVHEGKSVISSFLVGTVSAIVPHPVLPPSARIHFLLQLPVNPGNSGGPVFDPDTGRLIGIVSRRLEVGKVPTGLCICEPLQRLRSVIASGGVGSA